MSRSRTSRDATEVNSVVNSARKRDPRLAVAGGDPYPAGGAVDERLVQPAERGGHPFAKPGVLTTQPVATKESINISASRSRKDESAPM